MALGDENVSQWTLDTLHAHLDRVIEERDVQYRERHAAQQAAFAAALQAADRAIAKAEAAAEKRFESVNEFRSALSDQAATFLTRHEYETAHQSLVEKVDDLKLSRANTTGGTARTEQLWAHVVAFGAIVAVIVGIVSYFVK